jgi:manganese-dependent inorganic pyrophosphatase
VELTGTVYITGHKNPDLDSICGALGYAALKSRLDKTNTYEPVRCGHLSESTKRILNALGIIPPKYMKDVFPKVKDVCLTTDTRIEADAPLTELAKTFSDENPSVTPIYENGQFFGLLSVDDISTWFMSKLKKNGAGLKVPKIKDLMRTQEEPLQMTDFFEEAKLSLSRSKKRGLAVFDGEDFAGFVTRRCFLKAPRYNVILVDHNEPAQSINGIETANLLEIIDHHRLDPIKTDMPIFIDSEPLGSTCTIIYRNFIRSRLKPDKYTAKILLTGIMSDTLVLTSPTTTPIDIESAEALAKICEVDAYEFGKTMYSYVERLAAQDLTAAVLSDFKKYREHGVKFGIGQCEVTTLEDMDEYKEKLLSVMSDVKERKGVDWAVVMVTDVMTQRSVLFMTEHPAIKHLQYRGMEPGIMDMPGVVSRKKQLLPEIIHALGV